VLSACLKVMLLFVLPSTTLLHVPHDPFPFYGKNLNLTRTESATYVKSDELYDDFLLPRSSKEYTIEASEKSLLIFFLLVDTEKAGLEVKVEGPADRTRVGVVWPPESSIYYVSNEGEIHILVTNPQAEIVYYRFYLDISELLGASGSKTLPLEGGQVAFHIDLRKNDRVLLNRTGNFSLRTRVFVLYNELVPEGNHYSLYSYGESSYGSSSFAADLGGRYYVIIDSEEGKGALSLTKSIASPPWNQEWFWLAVLFVFSIVATFLANIMQVRGLDRTLAVTLVSYYLWLLTIGLFVSVIGSFSYGTSICMPLSILFLVSYGLSHGLQLYISSLDRKKTTERCPYCGSIVDLRTDNYCCGHIVKRISVAWFLMPLSLSFFFFGISYLVFSIEFLENSFLGGSLGSIVGGFTAWWINRTIYRVRSWKQDINRFNIPSYLPFMAAGFLVEGIIFSLVSPFLISFLLEMFFMQHTELLSTQSYVWTRERVAVLTLPLHITLTSILLCIVLAFFVVIESRRFSGKVSIGLETTGIA